MPDDLETQARAMWQQLPPEELSDLMGVSLRTVQRDLMTLQGEPFFVPLVKEVRWSVMERIGE